MVWGTKLNENNGYLFDTLIVVQVRNQEGMDGALEDYRVIRVVRYGQLCP